MGEVLFIEARWKGELSEGFLSEIEKELRRYKKVGLFALVQFLDQLQQLKVFLKKIGKEVVVGKGRLAKYEGQVLGCDLGAVETIKDKVDCFLYLGSGMLHLPSIRKPIIIANPLTQEVSSVGEEELKRAEKKKQILRAKFEGARRIGVLISIKPGQFALERALELKRELEKHGKEVYLFLFDTLRSNELLNFPQIDFWINTACPKLVEDLEAPALNWFELK